MVLSLQHEDVARGHYDTEIITEKQKDLLITTSMAPIDQFHNIGTIPKLALNINIRKPLMETAVVFGANDEILTVIIIQGLLIFSYPLPLVPLNAGNKYCFYINLLGRIEWMYRPLYM